MDKKHFRILSFDGGGIRGVLTAVWLAALEAEIGQPLHQCVDLVAGTSTGSILACAVAAGIPAQTIVEMYREEGRTVFPGFGSRAWGRAARLFRQGISAPKYNGKGLETVLKKHLSRGDAQRQLCFDETDLKARVLVITYDTFNRSALVLKNYKPAHQRLEVWEVCKASCSAPTYFPGTPLNIGQAPVPAIDGGVVANNPTACAVAEGVRCNSDRPKAAQIPLNEFVVASFGTGESTRPITLADTQEMGPIEWAVPIISVLFDGSGDSVDYIARQLLSEQLYFRFQVALSKGYDEMDDATDTNVAALIAVAEHYLLNQGGAQKVAQLGKLLYQGDPA